MQDNYRELNVDLRHASGRLLRLTFRAYNEGAALRYTFPKQDTKEFVFTGERTEFRFPEGTYGYEAHGTEDDYRRVKTADIQPYCERPLTLEYANGLFACLAEAANAAYPRMLLSGLAWRARGPGHCPGWKDIQHNATEPAARPDRHALARRLHPLAYVRGGPEAR